jgi:hypothetical protein
VTAGPPAIAVFVNERPLSVPAGSTVLAAVQALDPALAERVARRAAHVTDGRGIPVSPDEMLAPGSILRVVVSARGAGADAES